MRRACAMALLALSTAAPAEDIVDDRLDSFGITLSLRFGGSELSDWLSRADTSLTFGMGRYQMPLEPCDTVCETRPDNLRYQEYQMRLGGLSGASDALLGSPLNLKLRPHKLHPLLDAPLIWDPARPHPDLE